MLLAATCSGGHKARAVGTQPRAFTQTWDGYALVPAVAALAVELMEAGAGAGPAADAGVGQEAVATDRECIKMAHTGWAFDPWMEMDKLTVG